MCVHPARQHFVYVIWSVWCCFNVAKLYR
jgi:hypothetical protein